MRHAQGCTFETSVNQDFFSTTGRCASSGAASLGRNAASGAVELSLDDGLDTIINMTFKFCPLCGVQLIKRKAS